MAFAQSFTPLTSIPSAICPAGILIIFPSESVEPGYYRPFIRMDSKCLYLVP
jgi:hypothetical protein